MNYSRNHLACKNRKCIMKRFKRIIAFILTLSLLFCLPLSSMAAELDDGAQYLIKEVPEPEYGAVGGEWTIIAVYSGASRYPNDYFEKYYSRLERTVRECKGILSEDTYTEYSRVVLALDCIYKDPKDVAGCDLTAPLKDYDKVVYQGVNGAVYALLALDTNRYLGPRTDYINFIIKAELPEGGWNLFGKGDADPDMTAMALRALAPYKNQYKVKKAINSSIHVLEGKLTSSESISQCILAYDALGLDKPESLRKKLLEYHNSDGGFKHSLDDEESNVMSTEQAVMALSKY